MVPTDSPYGSPGFRLVKPDELDRFRQQLEKQERFRADNEKSFSDLLAYFMKAKGWNRPYWASSRSFHGEP